jgi:hypothetical protein
LPEPEAVDPEVPGPLPDLLGPAPLTDESPPDALIVRLEGTLDLLADASAGDVVSGELSWFEHRASDVTELLCRRSFALDGVVISEPCTGCVAAQLIAELTGESGTCRLPEAPEAGPLDLAWRPEHGVVLREVGGLAWLWWSEAADVDETLELSWSARVGVEAGS